MSTTTHSEFLTLKEPTTRFKPTDVVFFYEEDDDDNSIALYMFDWCNILPPTVPNSGIAWRITHMANSTSASGDTKTLTNQR
jgi:hypothetical protein